MITPDGNVLVTLANGAKVFVPGAVLVDASGAAPSEGNPLPVAIVDGSVSSGDWSMKFLTIDGSGNDDAAIDWSADPGVMAWICPDGYRFDIRVIRMIASIASGTLDGNGFVNIASPGLANGFMMSRAASDGAPITMMSPPIKTNAGWYNWGNGNPIFGSIHNPGFAWTLASPLSINAGERFQVDLSDDLSSINSLYFFIEGRLIPIT